MLYTQYRQKSSRPGTTASAPSLVNQCKPYELERGAAQALAERWTDRLAEEMTAGGRASYRSLWRASINCPITRMAG